MVKEIKSETDQKEKDVTNFLDYKIRNCRNLDGYVLYKPNTKYENLWECHLGNYSTLDDAKRSAIQYFMIKRANIFHAQIHHRMNGTHTCHDYFAFKGVLKKENILMPEECGMSDDYSCVLTFKGKEI